MTKYRIEYNRDGCIGAAACAAASGNWKINDEDGKADVLKKEIEDGELDENVKAAKECPVQVIQIFNAETNEKIV